MVETTLTCQYCGVHFETKSDLQDHEMNCLGAGQGQKQQQSGRARPTTGKQPTGNKTRSAGSGGGWNQESGL